MRPRLPVRDFNCAIGKWEWQTQLKGNECGNGVGDSSFILRIFTAKAARYVDVVMNLAAKRQTPKTAPLVYLAVLQAVMRGREAGDDGHGTVAMSTMLMGLHQPSSITRLSIRPRVDGTPVLTTVRRRDGGLSRPTAQRRDGMVVCPSVRPTVLDGIVLLGLPEYCRDVGSNSAFSGDTCGPLGLQAEQIPCTVRVWGE
ncbi:hypothetical protein B0H14DRAFT_2627179 [Mycena olivaceomarginata]|nr:hypothetical protein B0H14DRAFT_2627179 [Mycena olivaceomarginata]